MVKNTKGGKGAKSLARKNESFTSSDKLQLSSCELEKYACVTKMFGNGMCEITTNDNEILVGHIRGAFRGRQKHKNWVTNYCVVLVGMREWEEKRKNCDILCIYDDNQVEQLKNMPNVNIKNIVQLKNSHSVLSVKETADVVFTNETEEEMNEMLETVDEFNITEEREIDIDEI